MSALSSNNFAEVLVCADAIYKVNVQLRLKQRDKPKR